MSPEASRRHSRQGSGSLTRTGTAWFIAHDMRRLNRLHWVMGRAAPRVQPPMQVLKCPPPDDGVIVVVEQFGPVRGNGKPSGRIFPFSVGCTIRWNPPDSYLANQQRIGANIRPVAHQPGLVYSTIRSRMANDAWPSDEYKEVMTAPLHVHAKGTERPVQLSFRDNPGSPAITTPWLTTMPSTSIDHRGRATSLKSAWAQLGPDPTGTQGWPPPVGRSDQSRHVSRLTERIPDRGLRWWFRAVNSSSPCQVPLRKTRGLIRTIAYSIAGRSN